MEDFSDILVANFKVKYSLLFHKNYEIRLKSNLKKIKKYIFCIIAVN